MSKRDVMWAVLGIVLILCLWWYSTCGPAGETLKLVRSVAHTVRRDINAGMYQPVEKQDAWGNRLQVNVELDKYTLFVECVSCGPDGQFGTSDDISCCVQDVNKSRVLGKWIGIKWKQASQGFIDGLTRKSPFDKDDAGDPPE